MIGLDSDCIIDFLRGKKDAVAIVEKHKEHIVATDVNIFEIFMGIYLKKMMNTKEEEAARLFFSSLQILEGTGWGIRAAQVLSTLIKQGKEIEQNDGMIASILTTNGCDGIITRNSNHFSRIPHLKVVAY